MVEAPTPPELAEGSTLYNYQLRRLVGEGATSRVFLAEHLVRGDRVAVKALRRDLHGNDEYVRRFDGEARAATLVRHENVIRVFELGTYEGWQHYILMEFLDAPTLADELARGPMKLDRMAAILLPLCDALDFAHRRGVIHRDLKPEHIHLLARADGVRPVLVDFGAARRTILDAGDKRTVLGTILGTAAYMSPEQAAGSEAEPRSDVYALGVILFEMATGRVPFDSRDWQAVLRMHMFDPLPSPRTFNPGIGTALEQIIVHCLAKEPRDRFATMADVGRALFQARHRPETPPIVPVTPSPVAFSPGLASGSPGIAGRRHYRTQKPVDVVVDVEGGVFPEDAVASDLSLGGAFVLTTMRMPMLFSPVKLSLHLLDGDLELPAEVVRVESPSTGSTGRRGFAVRFTKVDAEARQLLERFIAHADPLPPGAEGDPEAARVIREAGAAPEADLYGLFGISPQADVWAIRDACHRLQSEVDAARFPAITEQQRLLFVALRQRLAVAEEVLVDPARRAEYDASRGNFAGVAQCLSEGLTLDRLAALRAAFLVAHPDAEPSSRPHLDRADRCEKAGDLDGALTWLAMALQADPLNGDLQRRYWLMRGALK